MENSLSKYIILTEETWPKSISAVHSLIKNAQQVMS